MASKLPHNKSTCIVGIGNPLRSDDGIGAYVCRLLEEIKIKGVQVIATQQLDTVMIAELTGFNQVIFVDAAVNIKTISFEPITENSASPQSFSHHINAVMFAKLAQQLYASDTQFYICAIPVENTDLGNRLSKKAKKNATEAVALLTAYLSIEG